MKCFAITNQKGGVAKTTTAVNLAAGLALRDNKVLLIDTDPQANATLHLGFKATDIHQSLDNLYYEEDTGIRDVILSRGDLDIIPAAQPLAYAEQRLAEVLARENMLRDKLKAVQSHYQYCIIDCPPNLGLLTMNAYVAATDIIVMIQPEFFALEGLKRITEITGLIQQRVNPEITISGYLLANFDARKKQHKAVQLSVRKAFGATVFNTMIRTNAPLSNCTSKGETIFEHDNTCYGAIDYMNLAKEVELRYGR